jgi:hypothetical protein
MKPTLEIKTEHILHAIYVSRNSYGFESMSVKLKGANALELLLGLFCLITLTLPDEEYTLLFRACVRAILLNAFC